MKVGQVAENLARTNKREYNYLKLIEELAELNEVLIKSVTKSKDRRPPIEKIIEESAHVIFRISVLAKMLNIEEEMVIEAQKKAKYLNDFQLADKYTGGL